MCRSVIQVEAKLELSHVRHEGGMPWRIEHDFNMNFRDTGQPREFALHVGFEHVAHTATGSRHGHLDMNPVHALLQGSNRNGQPLQVARTQYLERYKAPMTDRGFVYFSLDYPLLRDHNPRKSLPEKDAPALEVCHV